MCSINAYIMLKLDIISNDITMERDTVDSRVLPQALNKPNR